MSDVHNCPIKRQESHSEKLDPDLKTLILFVLHRNQLFLAVRVEEAFVK